MGATHFAMMEKIDGTTTKSGYEHRFRAVKARAKQINEQIEKGEIDVGATPVKANTKTKAGGGSKSGTPASKKRSVLQSDLTVKFHMLIHYAESRAEMAAEEDGSCAQNEDDEEDEKTPSKKIKIVKEDEESFF